MVLYHGVSGALLEFVEGEEEVLSKEGCFNVFAMLKFYHTLVTPYAW